MALLVKDLMQWMEHWAPLSLQESYDNAGLLVGESQWAVSGVLVALDVTEEVLDEAERMGCNLVIAHHPVIFGGLKGLTGRTMVERVVARAIKQDIALYAAHTNLDHVRTGVNAMICQKLGLGQVAILQPRPAASLKLTTFVPHAQVAEVVAALSAAGAGVIGNYSHCSFQVEGNGTFLGNEHTDPYIGQAGNLETVRETRLEMLVPAYRKNAVMAALRMVHPYEEVAYFLQPTDNPDPAVGAGMIGTLPTPLPAHAFLPYLKEKMQLQMIRHTALPKKSVQRVAVCGGAGVFLLKEAMAQKADVLVTSDFKYHDFFLPDGQLMVADIGHYESEVFTIELIAGRLKEHFPELRVVGTQTVTNPVMYYC